MKLELAEMLLEKSSWGTFGKGPRAFEEEVGVVTKAIPHTLDDLDLVVHVFEETGVQRVAAVAEDAEVRHAFTLEPPA